MTRDIRHCEGNLTLQSSHGLPEGIHALLEHGSARLKECALLSELRWLRGDELDLLVGELGDSQRRKNDVRKRLDEVTLNNLLGDSIIKYFDSSC